MKSSIILRNNNGTKLYHLNYLVCCWCGGPLTEDDLEKTETNKKELNVKTCLPITKIMSSTKSDWKITQFSQMKVMCSDPNCTQWGYKTRGQIRSRSAGKKPRGGAKKATEQIINPCDDEVHVVIKVLHSTSGNWISSLC